MLRGRRETNKKNSILCFFPIMAKSDKYYQKSVEKSIRKAKHCSKVVLISVKTIKNN